MAIKSRIRPLLVYALIFTFAFASASSYAAKEPESGDTEEFHLKFGSCNKGAYCAATLKNRLYTPDPKKADNWCKSKGHDIHIKFRVQKPGKVGVRYCQTTKRGNKYVGCFINKNPGNIYFTYVKCKKLCDPSPRKEENCASNVFHPDTKRCIPQVIVDYSGEHFFKKESVCILKLGQNGGEYCTNLPAWNACKDKNGPTPVDANMPPIDTYAIDPEASSYDVNARSDKIDPHSGEAPYLSSPEYAKCVQDVQDVINEKIKEKTDKGEIVDQAFLDELHASNDAVTECYTAYKEAQEKETSIGSVNERANNPQATPLLGIDDSYTSSASQVEPQKGLPAQDNTHIQSFTKESSGTNNTGTLNFTGSESGSSGDSQVDIAGAGNHLKGGQGSNRGAEHEYHNRGGAGSRGISSGNFSYSRASGRRGDASASDKVTFKPKKQPGSSAKTSSAGDGVHAKNQNYQGNYAKSIFEMVSQQYDKRTTNLATLDSYIRQQQRSIGSKTHLEINNILK